MNHARVARLHRELARVHEELAVALEEGGDAPDTQAPTTRKSAPKSRPRLVRPEGESDDLAKAKARRFLRENGLAQVKR